ncbi:MAG: DUF309 domain-containing protein [Alphaproteobacteria bacterium]|nr:DUF309 domain-containing protein [Alphaproteobacteria bacterium]
MPTPIPPPIPPPPLRLPDWPLPPYRYVPGLNPHPFRHPGGHGYTDGSAPVEAPWTPGPWTADRLYLRGLDLFDHRYWWEAHEVWEAIWHQVPRDEPFAALLQGLIQASAALLKRHLGHPGAAALLVTASVARLERAPADRGVDPRALAAALLDGQPFPTLLSPERPG